MATAYALAQFVVVVLVAVGAADRLAGPAVEWMRGRGWVL